MSLEYVNRCKFYSAALDLLEQNESEERSLQFIEYVSTLSGYSVNILLEDFVETTSLFTLDYIFELMQRRPLVLETMEATKMGILKIFNLYCRRQHDDGFGSQVMARFMLQVARSVKISDRSGVNLKGEKSSMHLRLMMRDGPVSLFAKAINELQVLLYSSSAITAVSTRSVLKVLQDVASSISPSLVECEDLLDPEGRQTSSPSFLVEGESVSVDVDSAIVILLQCLFLVEFFEDKDIRALGRQIASLLKKTVIGKRVSRLLPWMALSDKRWQRWKRELQCKDLSHPPRHLNLINDYPSIESTSDDVDDTLVNLGEPSSPVQQDSVDDDDDKVMDGTEWSKARRNAFQ